MTEEKQIKIDMKEISLKFQTILGTYKAEELDDLIAIKAVDLFVEHLATGLANSMVQGSMSRSIAVPSAEVPPGMNILKGSVRR